MIIIKYTKGNKLANMLYIPLVKVLLVAFYIILGFYMLRRVMHIQ